MKRDPRKPFTLEEIEAKLSLAQRARVRSLAAAMAADERSLAPSRKVPGKKAKKLKVEKAR